MKDEKKLIYDFICDEFYVPMKLKELAILLQVPKDQRKELKAIMDSLEAEGKVHVSKKGKYTKGEAKRIVGTYQAHARGFGFVAVEGEDDDIFISEDDTNGAFHGDQVEVTIKSAPDGKRREGKVVRILSHGTTRLVGYFQKNKKFWLCRSGQSEVYQGRIRAVRALERSSHRTQSSCGTYEIWGRQ